MQLLSLSVLTTIGQFLVEAKVEESTLFYTSPVSGAYKYYYDIKEARFLSNKDQHIFDENISREVMDKLNGVL